MAPTSVTLTPIRRTTCRCFLPAGASGTASTFHSIGNKTIRSPICSCRCCNEWGSKRAASRRPPERCGVWRWCEEKTVISIQYSVLGWERDCVRSTSRSAAAGLRHSRAPGKSGLHPRQSFFVIFVFLLLASTGFALAQSDVVVDFENAEITGRWIESWEEKGVVFTPAHAP